MRQEIQVKIKNCQIKNKSQIKNKKIGEMVEIVENVLDFNYYQNQEGQGLKILVPEQMRSRLPISLAQLKAGNNPKKLKNEIRQLSYSLYCSQNLSKTIYKHLISII